MQNYNPQKAKKAKIVDGIFDTIYFYRRRKVYESIKIEDVKKIVIFDSALIGDIIMLLPALRLIKKQFKDVEITLVCNAVCKSIIEDQGLVDKFITIKCPWSTYDYSFKNILNLISKIKETNNNKYDLAIDFRGDIRNIFFLNFVKAKRKISYDYTGGRSLLTDIAKADKDCKHIIFSYLNLLKNLGCSVKPNDEYPVLNVSDTGREFLKKFISDNKLENKKIIGVHPGASISIKEWGSERYSQLIKKVSNDSEDVCFLIFEGPKEENTVQAIINDLDEKNINYIHVKRPLLEYTWLLSICNLLVCNDSGAGHIASAHGVPTIVIFAHMNPELCQPLNRNGLCAISHKLDCKPCMQNVCKLGEPICIRGITVDEVYSEVKNMIDIG